MKDPDWRARSRVPPFDDPQSEIDPTATPWARAGWIAVAAFAALGVMGWAAYRLWPRTLSLHPESAAPVWLRLHDRDVVTLPGRYLVAKVGEYDDELYAHLMSQYLRSAAEFHNVEVLMAYTTVRKRRVYSIEVRLNDDLLASVYRLEAARTAGLIKNHDLRFVDEDTLGTYRYQSQVFSAAYSLAGRLELRDIERADLVSYVARFVQFKSAVDPRIRKNIEPVPRPLTRSEARRLAADIVTVADFYSLPVASFLGIGAMENNYMNVNGDGGHAIWKKRSHRGDIILKRGSRGLLVRNPSSGVWQITRETLRGIHNLYLTDHRDYSVLPERLRPTKQLDLDNTSPDVLTTYAGLLFRNLLDRFEGDLAKAIGAYNGGPGNPNLRYEQGVRKAAEHASATVMQAAALHRQPAAGMRFVRAAR